MVFVVLASASLVGTVVTVLDRPFARNKARHARISAWMLTATVTMLVLAAAIATADWLATGRP